MLLVFLVALVARLVWAVDVDICVIGAGPSGVQAAYAAEAAGYTTAIFEEESYIGGKTKTFTDETGRYKVGAVLHVGGRGNSLKNLLDQFNIERKALPELRLFEEEGGDSGKWYFPRRPFSFLVQVARYLKRRILLQNLNGPEGYLSEYPDELHMNLEEWLNKNRLSLLGELFWLFMTAFGYGHPKDVPALYGLKYIDKPTFFDYTIGGYFPSLSNVEILFFQDLLVAMASSLNGDIFLSASITDVSYGDSSNVVSYKFGDGATETTDCGSTIIAFAQTAEAMEVFTPPEAAEALDTLTSQVQFINYYSMLVTDPDSKFGTHERILFHTPLDQTPDNPAINVVYYKQFDSPTAGVTAYYLSPSEKTDEEARAESLASISTFLGRTVNETIVQDFNKWVYFPHVPQEALDAGFYQNFDDLQGVANQYYTGGLFNFDSVQDSMAHARHIIDTHFGNLGS